MWLGKVFLIYPIAAHPAGIYGHPSPRVKQSNRTRWNKEKKMRRFNETKNAKHTVSINETDRMSWMTAKTRRMQGRNIPTSEGQKNRLTTNIQLERNEEKKNAKNKNETEKRMANDKNKLTTATMEGHPPHQLLCATIAVSSFIYHTQQQAAHTYIHRINRVWQAKNGKLFEKNP